MCVRLCGRSWIIELREARLEVEQRVVSVL